MKNEIHNKGLVIAQNFYGIPQQKLEPVENMDLFLDRGKNRQRPSRNDQQFFLEDVPVASPR